MKTAQVAHAEAQYDAKLVGVGQLGQQHQAAKARQEQELKQAHDAAMELLKTGGEQWLAGHEVEVRKATNALSGLNQSVQVSCHLAKQCAYAFGPHSYLTRQTCKPAKSPVA